MTLTVWRAVINNFVNTIFLFFRIIKKKHANFIHTRAEHHKCCDIVLASMVFIEYFVFIGHKRNEVHFDVRCICFTEHHGFTFWPFTQHMRMYVKDWYVTGRVSAVYLMRCRLFMLWMMLEYSTICFIFDWKMRQGEAAALRERAGRTHNFQFSKLLPL